MYSIRISKVPNQELTFVVNDKAFRVVLRTIQDLTFASVFLNEEPLIHNQLCTPNNYVNLYNFISVGGKFYFNCIDGEYPNYKKFGDTQHLEFYTTDEL